MPNSSLNLLQGPKSKAPLVGFFWCPSTACDFVMATTQGLELYKRLPTNQGLHYVSSRKHPTAWCKYSHEARIALLAGSDGAQWVQVNILPDPKEALSIGLSILSMSCDTHTLHVSCFTQVLAAAWYQHTVARQQLLSY